MTDREDALERENAFLRIKVAAGRCPYGHYDPERGCDLGYPGCGCMDDMLALQAWQPEDEEATAVRLGRLLYVTQKRLEATREALEGAAEALDELGQHEDADAYRGTARTAVRMSLEIVGPAPPVNFTEDADL